MTHGFLDPSAFPDFLLTARAFLLTSGVSFVTAEGFCLQWEGAFKKQLNGLEATKPQLQAKKNQLQYRANGRGGFGSQTAAHPPPPPSPDNPSKADCGYCDDVSQNANPASTFKVSQCRHCKERLPGPRKGFWMTPGSLSPKTATSIYTL